MLQAEETKTESYKKQKKVKEKKIKLYKKRKKMQDENFFDNQPQ